MQQLASRHEEVKTVSYFYSLLTGSAEIIWQATRRSRISEDGCHRSTHGRTRTSPGSPANHATAANSGVSLTGFPQVLSFLAIGCRLSHRDEVPSPPPDAVPCFKPPTPRIIASYKSGPALTVRLNHSSLCAFSISRSAQYS